MSPHKRNFRIGIDLMGCSVQPESIALAVADLLSELPSVFSIVLFGTEEVSFPPPHARIECVVAENYISMDESPLYAVRRKKKSSLRLGLNMLRDRTLDAFISAGNTGALVASANLALPKLPGVKRTALLTLLPTSSSNPVAVLDVGANPTVKADHLVNYALMGLAFQKSRGIEHPMVGLLNIGEEASKGTPEVREAYRKLTKINSFAGNIEGRDVFTGRIHVLVTDGFTGNIFLKTAEGISAFILHQIENTDTEKNTKPESSNLLVNLRKRLHYAEYPGAVLCGVDGIVMKCHGDSSLTSFRNSLQEACQLLETDFLTRFTTCLSTLS